MPRAIVDGRPRGYLCGRPQDGREGVFLVLVLLQILDLLLRLVTYVIIAQAILSWLVAFNVINTSNEFVRSVLIALNRMTEPLYRPIRRILPDFGALDLSPMVVLLIVIILRDIVLPALFRSALT
jgi:YggT family protein